MYKPVSERTMRRRTQRAIQLFYKEFVERDSIVDEPEGDDIQIHAVQDLNSDGRNANEGLSENPSTISLRPDRLEEGSSYSSNDCKLSNISIYSHSESEDTSSTDTEHNDRHSAVPTDVPVNSSQRHASSACTYNSSNPMRRLVEEKDDAPESDSDNEFVGGHARRPLLDHPQPKRRRSSPGLDDSTVSCSETRPVRSACSPTLCLTTEDFKIIISLESQMQEILQILRETQQLLLLLLAAVKQILSHIEVPSVHVPDVFPISSKEELNELEQMDDIYDQTVKALKRIGGNDLKDFIKRAMPRLLRNSFAEQCNLTGAKNKTPLKETLIFKALFGAARMIHPLAADEKKMENEMRSWLSGARYRFGGSRHKKV